MNFQTFKKSLRRIKKLNHTKMFLRKINLLVIFFFAALISNGQGDTVNFVDNNNLKQGHWVITNEVKNLPGYAPTQVVEEGEFKDNRKYGKWYYYFSNDKVKQILTYNNNRPNGYAVFYYKNGNKREEGIWKNNRWVGEYKYYYENGNLKNHWNYNENGQRTGVQKYFHENGNLMIEGEWQNGKESGYIKEFYENGEKKSERYFNDGKLEPEKTMNFEPKPEKKTVEDTAAADTKSTTDEKEITIKKADQSNEQAPFDGNGYYELRNKSGQIVRKGEFENGYLINGEVYQYTSDGKIFRTTYYKEGRVIKINNHQN